MTGWTAALIGYEIGCLAGPFWVLRKRRVKVPAGRPCPECGCTRWILRDECVGCPGDMTQDQRNNADFSLSARITITLAAVVLAVVGLAIYLIIVA